MRDTERKVLLLPYSLQILREKGVCVCVISYAENQARHPNSRFWESREKGAEEVTIILTFANVTKRYTRQCCGAPKTPRVSNAVATSGNVGHASKEKKIIRMSPHSMFNSRPRTEACDSITAPLAQFKCSVSLLIFIGPVLWFFLSCLC